MKKFICDMALIFVFLGAVSAVGALIEHSLSRPVAVTGLVLCLVGMKVLYRAASGSPAPRRAKKKAAPRLPVRHAKQSEKGLLVA